jgi:IS5 family transposase
VQYLAGEINAASIIGMMKASSVDEVIVGSTVMRGATAHPTDSRLLGKSRQHLFKLVTDNSIALRQNYNREALRLAAQELDTPEKAWH